MRIRTAKTEDAPRLLEIYAQYIDTPVTFEYEPPSVTEFADRITEILKHHPYLVSAQ